VLLDIPCNQLELAAERVELAADGGQQVLGGGYGNRRRSKACLRAGHGRRMEKDREKQKKYSKSFS
jgi:hypothetical protein